MTTAEKKAIRERPELAGDSPQRDRMRRRSCQSLRNPGLFFAHGTRRFFNVMHRFSWED